MSKMTDKQLALFNARYNERTEQLLVELEEWRTSQVGVLKQADLKTFSADEHFTDFAEQSFLHVLKQRHDEWFEELAAIITTRGIADGEIKP